MDWFKPELKPKKEKDPIKEIVAAFFKKKERAIEAKFNGYKGFKFKHGKMVRNTFANAKKAYTNAIYKLEEAIKRGHDKDKALEYVADTVPTFGEGNIYRMRTLVELMNQNLDFFQQRGMWR